MTLIERRPPQDRVVNETLAHLQRGAKGVLIAAATGFGKTEVGVQIIKTLLEQRGVPAAIFDFLQGGSNRNARFPSAHFRWYRLLPDAMADLHQAVLAYARAFANSEWFRRR